MTPKRVLLVEDEEGLGEALEYQLGKAGYEVTWVTDGRLGLQSFKQIGHDLVLLDLMLPGMAGDEVCRRIRESSDVPIIMLTARDSESAKLEGFGLGTDDYVTKPFSTPELLARIKAVLRRDRAHPPKAALKVGDIELDVDRREVVVGGRSHHLPRKEFAVLHLLMQRAGRVVTRADLLRDVWGDDYVGDTRTLDVHIKRLREKLAGSTDGSPIRTVRGVGFKLVV